MPFTSGLPLTEAERARDRTDRRETVRRSKRRNPRYERPPPPGWREEQLRRMGEKDEDD